MASSEDIPSEDFESLIKGVSHWWNKHASVDMLKVLIRQFEIGIGKIDVAHDALQLFHLLMGCGELSITKHALIFEAAKICGLDGVQSCIKQINPTFRTFTFKDVEIRRFSHYRQNLIKFGKSLTSSSIPRLGDLYQIPYSVHKGDPWLLICALENHTIIGKNSAEGFVKTLRSTGMGYHADILQGEGQVAHSEQPAVKGEGQVAHSEQPAVKGKGQVARSEQPAVKDFPSRRIPSKDFDSLLVVVSHWWNKHGSVDMLKVLLRDYVGLAEILGMNDAMGLFQLLMARGAISIANHALVFEAAKICGLHGVQSDINKIQPFRDFSFDDVEIRSFSHYRQNLIKFGISLELSSIPRLGGMYQIHGHKHKESPWLLISALEDNMSITENSVDDFVNILRAEGMGNHADILEVADPQNVVKCSACDQGATHSCTRCSRPLCFTHWNGKPPCNQHYKPDPSVWSKAQDWSF